MAVMITEKGRRRVSTMVDDGDYLGQWEELVCGVDEEAELVENRGVYNGFGSSLGEPMMMLFHGWSLLMKEKRSSRVTESRTNPS